MGGWGGGAKKLNSLRGWSVYVEGCITGGAVLG